MAACLDPAQRIFTLLDPVFDITPPVLTLTHGKCREPRIGYNEKVSGKQLSHMPLDLGDHPAGLTPTFSLIGHVLLVTVYRIFGRVHVQNQSFSVFAF